MTSPLQPVDSYRILVLQDGYSKKIVKSPFQLAQILGPDYKPACKCTAPSHIEIHGDVHATPDDTKLHLFIAESLLLHQLEQHFVVRGEMYEPRYEKEDEVAGKRFLATKAFVSSDKQKRDLESAYRDWHDIEIIILPDLYERISVGHTLSAPNQQDNQTLLGESSLHRSEAALSLPRKLFSWL